MKQMRAFVLVSLCIVAAINANAQQTYFADGYHGGVWGHYPLWQTQFMVDTLRRYPEWAVNLEIEPETWDTVSRKDPRGYANFQELFKDSATANRIEFVSPAYAQGYLYTASGESMIRQFFYGMQKIKKHFPEATFTTYSSEEPCFTSALPQVLRSFGFKYAVLKNPNTCWGGYVKNYGGETMNWVGPDGTAIKLVPRYTSEAFEENSTWQTTAWVNSDTYMQAAFAAGIKHPVGMCLQDAGWKNGKWLGKNKNGSTYTTWRNYFEQIADTVGSANWRVSQEDIRVSLVWGAQVLQRIAQQSRLAENKLIVAEKMAAMAGIEQQLRWPGTAIDNAWRTLLLSQHHDCWIVPYNGKKGDTWADKVKTWTGNTINISDSIYAAVANTLSTQPGNITVYNTMAVPRTEIVLMDLPAPFSNAKKFHVTAGTQRMPAQLITNEHGKKQLAFNATVPAMGHQQFHIDTARSVAGKGAQVSLAKDGKVIMKTDLYTLVADPHKGGSIVSLISSGKEFVDTTAKNGFNALQGYFFHEDSYRHSSVSEAAISILDNGPLLLRVAVSSKIGTNAYVQTITLIQGEPRIEFNVRLDWEKNTGIGEAYKQDGGYEATDLHKAFYNDTAKLLITFPLAFKKQQVYVDAPFDVTRSAMTNTFFNTWDSIKNNVVLNWVDVADEDAGEGFALLTDHTTAYAHGKNFPLALVLQYSGMGLWGRNYTLDGPTSVNYSIIPHKGNWRQAKLFTAMAKWQEPLLAFPGKSTGKVNSFVDCSGSGWVVSSFIFKDGYYLLRLFNAEGDAATHRLKLGVAIKSAGLVQLNGDPIRQLAISDQSLALSIPEKGFATIKISRE